MKRAVKNSVLRILKHNLNFQPPPSSSCHEVYRFFRLVFYYDCTREKTKRCVVLSSEDCLFLCVDFGWDSRQVSLDVSLFLSSVCLLLCATIISHVEGGEMAAAEGGVLPATEGQDFTKMSVVDMMKLYYGWLYPHDIMYKWLVYGNGGLLCRYSDGYTSLTHCS